MTSGTFLPYTKQSISKEDIDFASKSLANDLITRGPTVLEFEKNVANYCGAKYGVAFNSGTSAFSAAYSACNISSSDRVLTSPITFVGTLSGALLQKATPVFVDIDSNTLGMDLDKLEPALELTSTRGKTIVVPVHLSGIPTDMLELSKKIKQTDIVIIEDGCQALGSTYPDGEKVGSCSNSDMTVFSFHPAKSICTGEGGMVLTNNNKYYQALLKYRNNGIVKDENHPLPWQYEVQSISNNFNFTDFQASLGISQLKRIDEFMKKRKTIVNWYRKRLSRMNNIELLPEAFDNLSAHNLFIVQIDFEKINTNRAFVMNELKKLLIGTQVHFIPLYRHPYFVNIYGEVDEYFPNTERYYQKALSLPMYVDLTEEQVARVCYTLKQVLKRRPPRKGKRKR